MSITNILKSKYVTANEGLFMDKELRKTAMLRSKLRNSFNQNKTDAAQVAYKKQRNISTNLLRKTKSDYCSNITDKKKFRKTVKLLFSPFLSTESFTIVETETIYTDDSNRKCVETRIRFHLFIVHMKICEMRYDH